MYTNVAMIVIVLCLLASLDLYNAEKPCAARQIPGQSVVCVCNKTYCDEIVREVPKPGSFVSYTTSEKGSRFLKGKHEFAFSNASYYYTIDLNPRQHYQTIEGFGGAVTDSAAINWKTLSRPLQKQLISSYFSRTGIEYNMLRVPIGGTDFSVRGYAYNEYPVNDTKLSNFTLVNEDIHFKIPMIKEIFKAATSAVHIVATTWSPPVWMKTNNNYTGYNQLLKQYYQTYADYHLKFLQKYAEQGVPVWAITTTNEPENGIVSNSPINCLGWTPTNLGQWIAQNLGPTIRNSRFKNVKILAVDDQRHLIPVMFNLMIKYYPEALEFIDGIAVHFYTDFLTPTLVLKEIARDYPEKFVLATEACEGSFPWQKEKVKLGSWKRAVSYITDIMTDLNNNLVGWMDWNICLNQSGGPCWVSNFVDSPVIVFPEKNEFVKQPMFYGMGHFSKFIPRGSKRIFSERRFVAGPSISSGTIDFVAFLNPQDTVIVVVYNPGSSKTVCLVLEGRHAVLELEADSVVTAELPYKSKCRD